MRLIIAVILTLLFAAVIGYLSAVMRMQGVYYRLIGFPAVAALAATALLMIVLHVLHISERRSRLWLGVLTGVTLLVCYQAFSYQIFMAQSYQGMQLSYLSEAEGYALIDRAIQQETGYAGYFGYLLWIANNSGIYLGGAPDGFVPGIPLDTWINYGVETVLFIGIPLVVVHLTSRRAVDNYLLGAVNEDAVPIAYFRNPSNESAAIMFREKDWKSISESVYVGKSPDVPALEIYQTANVDPVTRQPYLQLVQRTTHSQTLTLKTLSVNPADLRRFKAGLQTYNKV